jgi:RND family efflux transporter MFP subunit
MDEKSALLAQLRIDRGEESVRPSRSKFWIVLLIVALLVIAAGAAAWEFFLAPKAPTVHVVVAQAASSAAAAPNSILDASGYVVARRQATVSSKVTGKMTELDIEEGDHVKSGQIIAKLDDSNIRAAREQASAQLDYARAGLAETEVNLANAERDYTRQSSLLKDHYVSQAAVDASRTTLDALRAQLATQKINIEVAERGLDVAARSLDDTVVRAPFAGVVTVKAAQPGEIVSPISAGGGFTRTGIGTIVDMDSLEIQVDVNENFINRVHPDQIVSAKLNAYPDWQIPAHVIAVIPTADRSKGTVTVRIAIDQKDARILPEMGVRVSFLDERNGNGAAAGPPVAPGGISLPKAAALGSGEAGVIFVLHGDTIERRAVKLGAPDGARIMVLSGLAAGERVAVGDPGQLKDGIVVHIEQGVP